MNSEELNKRINELDSKDREDLEIIGGKCIPYVGWFWRNVDFDSETYSFGICEEGNFNGFMENNKWDYNYTRELTKEEWLKVKELLVKVVENPTKETTRTAWDYIQKFTIKQKAEVREE